AGVGGGCVPLGMGFCRESPAMAWRWGMRRGVADRLAWGSARIRRLPRTAGHGVLPRKARAGRELARRCGRWYRWAWGSARNPWPAWCPAAAKQAVTPMNRDADGMNRDASGG